MDATDLLIAMWVRGDEREASATDRIQELYESIEAGAFWAAIVFPVGYVPFLTGGMGTPERAAAFAGLVVVHFLLLTIGHAYER